jgi:hypothetical protein
LFQAKISTVSDGHILQSGGSCYLKATDNGDSVYLLPGKEIKIDFESSAKDSLMSTFYGERNADGVLTWKPATENIDIQDTLMEVRVEPLGISDSQNKSKNIKSKLNTSKLTYDTLYYNKTYMTTSKTTRNRVFTHFYLDSASNNNQTILSDTRSHKKYGDYILQPVIRYGGLRAIHYVSKVNTKIANEIRSNRFGYINCDHFMGESNLENIILHSHDTIVESYMFFKNSRSCMASFGNTFDKVPHHSNVLFLVIFSRNNKMFMSLNDATTETHIYINNPVPFDVEKIELELNKVSRK